MNIIMSYAPKRIKTNHEVLQNNVSVESDGLPSSVTYHNSPQCGTSYLQPGVNTPYLPPLMTANWPFKGKQSTLFIIGCLFVALGNGSSYRVAEERRGGRGGGVAVAEVIRLFHSS